MNRARLKLHTAVMERPDGTLGVIRREGVDEATFTNDVLWAARAIALAAEAQLAQLDEPDAFMVRVRAAAMELADSVWALGERAAVEEEAEARS